MSKSIANYKLRRDLYLLWRLCETHEEAADLLAVNKNTFTRALTGLPTTITRDDVRAAARAFAKGVRRQVDKYEWGAIQLMVRLIDPTADVAYRSTTSVDSFPRQVDKWLTDNYSQSLGACVKHFVNRDLKPKAVRQAIERRIKRDPVLAMRVIYDMDEMVVDVINKHQRIVTEAELIAARNPTVKDPAPRPKRNIVKEMHKPLADIPTDKAFVRRKDGPMVVTQDDQQTIPEAKAALVKATTEAVQADRRRKAKSTKPKPAKKKDTLGGVAPEMSLMEKVIAKREAGEGPTPEQQARIDRLLGINT